MNSYLMVNLKDISFESLTSRGFDEGCCCDNVRGMVPYEVHNALYLAIWTLGSYLFYHVLFFFFQKLSQKVLSCLR